LFPPRTKSVLHARRIRFRSPASAKLGRLAPQTRWQNAAIEQADEKSLLNLYRRFLELRTRQRALQVGQYTLVHLHREVLSHPRNFNGR